MATKKTKQPKKSDSATQAVAEAAYGQAMMRHAAGDKAGALAALEQTVRLYPNYAPAILTMGSVEYQREQQAEGKRLLFSLLSLPRKTEDLFRIIDEAGSFLIDRNELDDGFELYRKAVRKFPNVAQFHQRLSYCAAQEGMLDEALAESRRAIELEPDNAGYESDMGWTLVLAERYQEAEAAFLRSLAIDPSNEHAQANLEYCRERLREGPSLMPPEAIQPTPSETKPRGSMSGRKKRSPRRG